STFIFREGQGYSFNKDAPAEIDTILFQEGAKEALGLAETKNWTAATERFDEATSLYRGEFLAEDRYEDWAEETRSQLQRQYLDSMSELAKCYEQLGRLRQAISCCQQALALEPHRESMIQRLMEYQVQAGQRGAALDSFMGGERALREHLDVEPSAATLAIRDRISKQANEDVVLDPRRVAVLPLQNFSPDSEDEYLADGMTEELIGTISMIKDLRVIARTSVMRYRGTTRPVSQIALELSAGTILEGSVRKAGGKARISLQLIDASTEDHIWAEHFDVDLGDVLEVQGGIARRVSEALEVKLLRGEEEALRTVERGGSEAHVAYLKGRHLLQKSTREALDTAIGYFEEAFARDPEHARALAGLADAYCMMVSFTSAEESYPRARRYAEQAIALDGSLAEAHNSLAGIALGYEGKPGKAERLMRRAIQLDPNCALAHTNLGILLAQADRTDEAIEAVRVALALDPLSPPLIAAYAECLYTAARFHEAIEQAKKALELDPEEPCADWVFWYSLAATWDWDRAEEVLRQNVARYPENPLVYLNLAACVMCRGRLQEGIVEVEKALALPGATEQIRVLTLAGSHYYFARNYDRALALLNEALERIPTNRLARIARSLTYLMLGRHGDCLEDLEEAERIVEGADVFWSAYVHMNRGEGLRSSRPGGESRKGAPGAE
ncbi:tetratricopeptide repeat protein, partial [Candidatus Bipolaricaulota bacterium]